MPGKHVQLVFNDKNKKTALNERIIDRIDGLLEEEINKQTGHFSDDFWIKNFNALYKRDSLQKNDSINADRYLKIHGEIVSLRYIEIALIKKLQENHPNVDEVKPRILQAFQNSNVYKKYLGKDGINEKIQKSGYRKSFGDGTLEKILNTGESEEDKFILPNLTVNHGRTFDQIVKELELAESKLKKSLELIKITEDKQFKQLTQAILMADSITLAMTMYSKQGKLCIAEMENVCKKNAIEYGLWIISAVCVSAIIIILTPSLTVALPVSVATTILIKVTVSAICGAVSKKIQSLEKYLETKVLPENPLSECKIAVINDIKIDNKQSKALLKKTNNIIIKAISQDQAILQ